MSDNKQRDSKTEKDGIHIGTPKLYNGMVMDAKLDV